MNSAVQRYRTEHAVHGVIRQVINHQAGSEAPCFMGVIMCVEGVKKRVGWGEGTKKHKPIKCARAECYFQV